MRCRKNYFPDAGGGAGSSAIFYFGGARGWRPRSKLRRSRASIIDEAARVPDEVYLAMRPALVLRNGDLWLMSTPLGKRGFFYEAWANGDPTWTRVLSRRRRTLG